ncbi:MAG: hypothetical protein HYR96_11615 [Deltaproteobacteria bacterium]|nr:hypothetical protein [Deltaproteobacteria bacterium]
MKPEEIKVVIGEVDGLIRKGEGNAAQKRLLDLAKGRLPRPQLLPVAVLMRRAGLPDWGIRLLNPIIRTTSKALSTATEAEKAEYAASLTRIGATQEALRILSGLNATSTPEALLFQSIAQFTLWDYAAALPLLARFVATPSISDYQRLVGSVNLLAALIHEKHFERADGLLKQLLERTKTPELNLLHGNILELAAQNAIFHADWKAADGYIQQSEAALSNTNTMDAFYTRKWRAVLALMQAPNKEASRSGLENVRREARERRHWETLRDCDYFEAIARRDGALGARLYFGTPYVAYR